MLPGVGVHAPEGLDLPGLEDAADIRRARDHAGGEAVGADDELAGGADELELHEVPLGELGDKAVGGAVELAVAVHGVADEVVAGVGGPCFESVQHHIIIVVGHDHAERARHQQGHHQNGAQGADEPAPAQARDLDLCLAHVMSSPAGKCGGAGRDAALEAL